MHHCKIIGIPDTVRRNGQVMEVCCLRVVDMWSRAGEPIEQHLGTFSSTYTPNVHTNRNNI